MQKKSDLEKRKRFEASVRTKYDVEITDATEFRQTMANADSPAKQKMQANATLSPSYSLIGSVKRDFATVGIDNSRPLSHSPNKTMPDS